MPFDLNFTGASGPLVFTVLAVILLLAVLWIAQFVRLMSLEDDEFHGRFDRYGWIAAFVLIFWLAPIAFMIWRPKTRPRDRSDSSRRTPS